MLSSSPMRLEVRSASDASTAAACAVRISREQGLTSRDAASVGIAAAELAHNIVIHGGGSGVLELSADGRGVTIVASDHGPGLLDPDSLFLGRQGRIARGQEGGRGLGEGGAALVRLMDEVAAEGRAGGGLRVRVSKWR